MHPSQELHILVYLRSKLRASPAGRHSAAADMCLPVLVARPLHVAAGPGTHTASDGERNGKRNSIPICGKFGSRFTVITPRSLLLAAACGDGGSGSRRRRRRRQRASTAWPECPSVRPSVRRSACCSVCQTSHHLASRVRGRSLSPSLFPLASLLLTLAA